MLVGLSPCRSAETTPRDLLAKLSSQYYDLAQAGLARASCYVESREILAQLDQTARTLLKGPNYEATIVPGKPVTVKVRDLPENYGRDARAGVSVFCLGAQVVLDAVFKTLTGIPELLDPERVYKNYDVSLAGTPGAWQVVLDSKALVDHTGRRLLLRERREDRASDARPAEHIVLTLDRDGRLHAVTRVTAEQTEKTEVTLQQVDDRWLVKALDTRTCDPQDRLIERRILSLTYSANQGIYLPTRLSSRVVDADGRTVHRRNEANPVTIRLSQYRVELRQ
jgi:hypothetical protein